jgi:hypothetical protein
MSSQDRLLDDAAGQVAAEGHAGERKTLEVPTGAEARSGYGLVPGAEFPAAVYISVLAAFAWILLASWLAFARDEDAAFNLGIAAVLAIVFFALPTLVHLVAARRARRRPEAGDFLSSRVDTATGPLSGASAWLQVLLIPAALALAATLIGATSVLVH